jgi:hypothetical protein
VITGGRVRLIERRRRWLRALGAIFHPAARQQPDGDLHLGPIQLAQPILTNPDIPRLPSSCHAPTFRPPNYIIL